MLVGRCSAHPPSNSEGALAASAQVPRGGRLRQLALAAALTLAIVALSPAIAHAEEAEASIEANCSSVTINFTGYPNAENNMVTV